jgi:biopolymer transport protein ExbD
MRFRAAAGGEKIELQMTPMIDIVFQLLIFFTLTFKIAAPEGDFNIKMPLAAQAAGTPDPSQLPPVKVRLKAGSGGRLSDIVYGNKTLGRDFNRLRGEIRLFVGDNPTADVLSNTEVEFDCDYDLRYEYVVSAITAVSGYVDPETRQLHRLVEKIKFSPPRKPD